jgi:hypothetical protein
MPVLNHAWACEELTSIRDNGAQMRRLRVRTRVCRLACPALILREARRIAGVALSSDAEAVRLESDDSPAGLGVAMIAIARRERMAGDFPPCTCAALVRLVSSASSFQAARRLGD